MGVGADGGESVVEGLFFCLVDCLVDFAVVGDFGGSDAEVFAICRGDEEFFRLGCLGGVVFAYAVEDGEDLTIKKAQKSLKE